MKLKEMRCVPCEAGSKTLEKKEIARLLKQLPKGWKSVGDKKITKQFKFKNYPETISFVNRAALIAQDEGHHPDFMVHYSVVEVEIWTHAIGGLSENDFILASKIDSN